MAETKLGRKVHEENKHESQEQIKMYQALEPIPESDGHGTNYGEALSKGRWQQT